MEKKKVIIDNSCDIVYSSFYLDGLYELFGRKNVGFDKLVTFPNKSGNLIIEVRENGKNTKYAISLSDSYRIKEDLYDWCDVYGSVNANVSKTPEKFVEKLVPLCPSFGVRCWDLPYVLFPQILPFGALCIKHSFSSMK